MYFKFHEFIKSDVADLYNIDNTPLKDSHLVNIANLWNQLEEIRFKLGKPIIVNSGYRVPELNKLVAGAKNSLHMQGRAADICCEPALMPLLKDILKEYDWSELIEYPTFYHVAL